MKTYLTKEQILERIQALPKKSKYLTREEINQRMNLACELDNYIHRIQSQIYCFWFLVAKSSRHFLLLPSFLSRSTSWVIKSKPLSP